MKLALLTISTLWVSATLAAPQVGGSETYYGTCTTSSGYGSCNTDDGLRYACGSSTPCQDDGNQCYVIIDDAGAFTQCS